MIQIGHASTGENGGRNNAAGDQTGKEVKISNWYANGWNQILRPKTQELAEKMATICETLCRNECIGYDMNQRNTLHTELKKLGYDISKLNTLCETDCSAFMTVIAIAAGVTGLEYTTNAPVCSTMKGPFKGTGKFYVIEDKKITNSDKYLNRGDILINTKKHTVMALNNGSCYNECFIGVKGYSVLSLQKKLASKGYTVGTIDGDFGKKTDDAVRMFQMDNCLTVDGIVGPNTWKALK